MRGQRSEAKRHPLDAQVGEELGPVEYRVTENMIREHTDRVDDHNSWYFEKSPFGDPIAPASIIIGFFVDLLGNADYGSQGSVHTAGSYEFINPIRQGKLIKLQGKIVDKYNKRGRDYIVVETVITDEDGLEIGRSKDEELEQRVT